MDDKKKAFREDDLTEEDRLVLGLYEETQEPIEWDESDDTILSFAREAQPRQQDQSAAESDLSRPDRQERPTPPEPQAPEIFGDSSSKAKDKDSGEDPDESSVVAFAPRKPSLLRRIVHSPATGFAMAASLLLGVFLGHGISPYIHPDAGPGGGEEPPLTRGLPGQGEQPLELQTPLTGALAGLSGLFGEVTCGHVEWGLSQGSTLKVAGYVGSLEEKQRLQIAISELAGGFSRVDEQIAVAPAPFCQALQVLGKGTGAAVAGAPVIRPLDHPLTYQEGENLVLEAVTAADSGGYLTVDYIQADGTVVHLLPDGGTLFLKAEANQSISIGASGEGYRMGAPQGDGRDLVVILQSAEPLFSRSRPTVEPVEAYLDALQQAMSAQTDRGLGGQLRSNHIFLTTRAAD